MVWSTPHAKHSITRANYQGPAKIEATGQLYLYKQSTLPQYVQTVQTYHGADLLALDEAC